MHEIHIVRQLIDTVEKQARAQGARRVTRVQLRFNPLVSFDAEHVAFSFDIAKKETVLVRDASLELVKVPGVVRCLNCRHEFEAAGLPAICSRCQSVHVQPVNPTELRLELFDIER